MIVTKKYIENLREKSFMKISVNTEKRILKQFGAQADGYQHIYTEQDIIEQIRKMVQ